MSNWNTPDFGRCPCDHDYANRVVEVKLASMTSPLSDVPQGACPACGGRVYKVETLRRIEALFRRQPANEKT